MKKLIAILAVALAIPTMSFADDKGRYQGILSDNVGIWIVDTKLGEVKYCRYTNKYHANNTLVCDAWSVDEPKEE